ncbi:6069_t:CDS:1, partial [Rhizophagus irregularis]
IGSEVTSQWIFKLSLGDHASVSVCNIFFSLVRLRDYYPFEMKHYAILRVMNAVKPL